jgi:hypothetical protein
LELDAWPFDATSDTNIADSGTLPDADPCAGLVCPLGCNVPQGRCYRLTASNNIDASGFHDQLAQDQTFPSGTTVAIDTDTGEISAPGTFIRPANTPGMDNGSGIFWFTQSQGISLPDLSIFGMASLTVPMDTVVIVQGEAALVIYAAGDVTIHGVLSAPAKGAASGPGGYKGGMPALGGEACFGGEGLGGTSFPACESGGGGGGSGAAGGTGGDTVCYASISPGAAGAAVSNPTLVPLYGGCGGGGGGYGPAPKSAGGGGGGAIQISASGVISVIGVINAPGAGGRGSGIYSAGGGGGSGGSILLEGAGVMVSGMLAANGGGGGGGGGYYPPAAGQNGQASLDPATGGTKGDIYVGGDGGDGGAGSTPAGLDGQYGTHEGGGGGGGAGRIRLNGLNVTCSATNASPAPATGTTVGTW